MISFPNAKINLGLNVVEKRLDGYHNLQTIFYPIQVEDILEIDTNTDAEITLCGTMPNGKYEQVETGSEAFEKNLVVKAFRALQADYPHVKNIAVKLTKYIPSGAGMGGGSADASFMLRMLNKQFDLKLTDEQLENYAVKLGADCPVFIKNKPVYAEGIGEKFTDIDFSLKGYYLVLVKPDTFISTREAFANIHPHYPEIKILDFYKHPVEEWKDVICNDFEASIFPNHPEIKMLKENLYSMGAVYASMTGSGSTVYGIFKEEIVDVEKLFVNNWTKCIKL